MAILFQVVDKINDATLKNVFRLRSVVTDTSISRLHYKYTIILVGIYSLFHVYVNTKSSISCMGSMKHPKFEEEIIKAIENYCWTQGTYSVWKANNSRHGEIYTGVSSWTGSENEEKGDRIVVHHYYKWMYFFIFFKIISLYFPHFVWRNIENGLMKQLCDKVNKRLIIEEDQETKKLMDNLAEYFYRNLGSHGKYAYGLVFSEGLNVIVAILLLCMWNGLTGGELSLWSTGVTWSALNQPSSLRTDTLARVFPAVAKCTFKRSGVGGNLENHDFICVLPMNVVNERAAVFFWYYFMVLVAVGLFQVIFRIMLIIFKQLRASLLSTLTPITTQDEIDFIIENSSYSDWFIMNQFGLNVEPIVFRHVLKGFVDKLRARDEN